MDILILPAWAALATILPYLILTTFVYAPVDYPFCLGELFSKGAYLSQIKLTLSGLSPVHIFFLTIGIIIIVRRRDGLSLFTFIWIVNYFLLQIIYSSGLIGVFRLLIPYFPVLAIWMAEGVGVAVKRKEIFKRLVVPFLAYAILTSTIWIVPPLSQRLVMYHNIHSRYLPYHEAILYLKDNLGAGERCLSPGHSSPEKFYCLKFGLSPSRIDHAWWWGGRIELQTGDNLYEYAIAHNIKFCLFPSGDWPKGFLNFALRDRLVRGEDKRFILKKVFLSGQNKLYLLEVR